ncbi:MAG: hypothetical protein GY778_15135 [bacterium]|nr:hypothetical protein [bacterium]
MSNPLLASLSSNFTWIDWAVVVGYLAFTTYLGAKLAGRQASIRDFFLGGRKLPWYAVSGSIIATEISALTFVSVPSVVFKMDIEGNFKYLQLGIIGTFLARVVVGYVLVPAYYKREIYSPYDYMGNQLGGKVRVMTTVLFSLGGILGQSARVYLTAEVLMVVLRDQLLSLQASTAIPALAWAIIFIGVVSTGWTLIGGITTVIWTDVILFLVFLLGAFVALGTVAANLEGGLFEMFRVGWDAKGSGPWGKFTFFDFDRSPLRQYTIWTAAIASTWGGLGAYGTDQLLAQRMFCCKNARDARWAIISSTASQVVTLTVMLVGVGLFAYYKQMPPPDAPTEFVEMSAHPDFPMLRGEALEMYTNRADRIFPIFILEKIPTGLKGLIIAAIFAAAISSLMGILTALSQVVMTAFYNPLRERHLRKRGIEVALSGDVEALGESQEATAEDRRSVLVGRLMVVFWGAVLCVMAYLAQSVAENYKSILDLGLAMVGFTGGALLAGFALSFLRLGVDGRGFMWAAPLSVFFVFAVVWHVPWTQYVCWLGAAGLLVTWVWLGRNNAVGRPVLPFAGQTVALLVGVAAVIVVNRYGYVDGGVNDAGAQVYRTIAWPWYVPAGSTVAFVWGYLLARRRDQTA